MSIDEYVTAALSIRNEMDLEVSCTLDAIEDLRVHLAQLESLLESKQYETASALGYDELSTGYVYVQRCLGGVESLQLNQQLLVKDLARKSQCTELEAQQLLDSRLNGVGES